MGFGSQDRAQPTVGLFTATALAGIIGRYLPYLWLRAGRSVWLLVPATSQRETRRRRFAGSPRRPDSRRARAPPGDREAFPADYRGDAFVALHGSHSRPQLTGYKVVRVRMEGGRPTGVYEDFMTGFVVNNETVWGRPAGVAVMRDGSLLVSDDANGTIYRVVARN